MIVYRIYVLLLKICKRSLTTKTLGCFCLLLWHFRLHQRIKTEVRVIFNILLNSFVIKGSMNWNYLWNMTSMWAGETNSQRTHGEWFIYLTNRNFPKHFISLKQHVTVNALPMSARPYWFRMAYVYLNRNPVGLQRYNIVKR